MTRKERIEAYFGDAARVRPHEAGHMAKDVACAVDGGMWHEASVRAILEQLVAEGLLVRTNPLRGKGTPTYYALKED
jgi:hypothetical protein